MGSGSRRRENTGSDRAHTNGEAGAGAGGGSSESAVATKKALEVSLINIDAGIHDLASVNEAVIVSGSQVVTSFGRLGDIAPRYLQEVRQAGYTRGVISNLGPGPSAKVRLM